MKTSFWRQANAHTRCSEPLYIRQKMGKGGEGTGSRWGELPLLLPCLRLQSRHGVVNIFPWHDFFLNGSPHVHHYFSFYLTKFKKRPLFQSQFQLLLLCSWIWSLLNLTRLIFFYFVDCRYRKVVGDTCSGGMEDQLSAEMASCPILCM